MKKLKCALAGLLFVLMLPTAGWAQFGYETNNGTITITYYDCSAKHVTIPETINGLPVTRIGGFESWGNYVFGAFEWCYSLETVSIPAERLPSHLAEPRDEQSICTNAGERPVGGKMNPHEKMAGSIHAQWDAPGDYHPRTVPVAGDHDGESPVRRNGRTRF